MKNIKSLLLAAILIFTTSAPALSAGLDGAVKYENGLYTYTYTLQSDYEFPVLEVLLLVNSAGQTFDIAPLAISAPSGWDFSVYGGYDFNGNAAGVTYWGWGGDTDKTGTLSSFSFTTTQAPAKNPVAVTYGLWSPAYLASEPANYFDYGFYIGSVVAPDFLTKTPIPTPVPEPETYAMLLAGLSVVGFMARRRNLVITAHRHRLAIPESIPVAAQRPVRLRA